MTKRKNKGKGVLDESERSQKPVHIPSPSSSTALSRHEPSSERSQNPLSNLPSVGSTSSQSTEVAIVGGSEPDEWDDPNVLEIMKLLCENLHTLFTNAIKKIVSCGFSENAAKKSISGIGVYLGGTDLLSNVVENALASLERKKQKRVEDSSVDGLDLLPLAKYTILEMVLVLKQVQPSLSIMDAVWGLLLCDLNISQACTDEFINFLHNKQASVSIPTHSRSEAQSSKIIPPSTSEPNAAKPSTLNAQGNLTLASEVKSGTSQNARSKKELAALQQKSSHGRKVKTDKSYGKGGAFRSGKLASSSSLSVEKKLKPLSEVSVEHVKGASSKVRIERGAATNPPLTIPVSGSSSILPTKGNLSALPAANTELVVSSSSKKNPAPRVKTSTPVSLKMSDDYAGIPFDESRGKHVPQDNKDEQILRLATRVQSLMNELNGWDTWANQKVMQATRRLKALRKEKQEVNQWKEDQTLSESTMKELAEVESAVNDITSLAEKSESIVRTLEEENTLLRNKLVAAKVVAEESAERTHEALQMEQKLLKSASTWETQKSWLQEELQTEKQQAAELQRELDKAIECHKKIEVLCKQETTQKEKLLEQAASIRSEREQLEKDAKEEEGRIKLEMKKEKKKYTEDMKKLQAKVSVLKFQSDSSKMAANPATSKGNQISGSKVERECVMCLEEEMSVVLVPCGHQVLCSKCNELHEKQGMKECPSCRTPIEQRIRVRSAKQ